MLFECWLQLRGEAGRRQIASVAAGKTKALTHNLGGGPGACVSFVSVVGSQLDS
jgi:acetyl-CoA C-acetyltransferase